MNPRSARPLAALALYLMLLLVSLAACSSGGADAGRPRVVGSMYPLAWLAEMGGRITGREPFLTLDALRMAAHHMYYTSAKASCELGYTARPATAALEDAIDWFRVAGMIRT